MKAKLALTCGDPAGIGPEVVAAWLASPPPEAAATAVIGPARWLQGLPAAAGKVAVGLEKVRRRAGAASGRGGGARRVGGARTRRGRLPPGGILRGGDWAGPGKAELARIGWAFPGQTEFFAAKWGGEPTMAFCGGKLRVVLLTWHVPLREVPSHLTAANLARAVAAADRLARVELGPKAPVRIGVCGLNPHAGEGGLLGTEERDLIDPVLDGLRAQFPGLSRTQPGDTVFGRQLRGEFDVALALYHDQGLAPLRKTVDFDEADDSQCHPGAALCPDEPRPRHGLLPGGPGEGQPPQLRECGGNCPKTD